MNRLVAMETFVRVIEAGSFSAAAKQLRVGQPAVSKTIAQLEDRLGVRLLLRSTHGLTPTEAGRSFYERAKRSIEEAKEAELAARGAGATLSGRLRVCAPVTFARLQVVPRLPAFLAEYPAIDLDMVLDDRNIDLIEAGIDVALRLGRQPDSTLTARKIAECRAVELRARSGRRPLDMGEECALLQPAKILGAGDDLLPGVASFAKAHAIERIPVGHLRHQAVGGRCSDDGNTGANGKPLPYRKPGRTRGARNAIPELFSECGLH